MRDINLNDPVSITVPAHVWLMAMSAYAQTEWTDSSMNQIITKVQEAIIDPLWLNEQMAAHQQEIDRQQGMFHGFMTGQPPETPPNEEEL